MADVYPHDDQMLKSVVATAGQVNAVSPMANVGPVKPAGNNDRQVKAPGGENLPSGTAPVRQNDAVANESVLDEAVQNLNDHVQTVNRELQFTVDKDSGKTVIKVIDKETHEVIRQIPGEEALNVARRLNEGGELALFSSYT